MAASYLEDIASQHYVKPATEAVVEEAVSEYKYRKLHRFFQKYPWFKPDEDNPGTLMNVFSVMPVQVLKIVMRREGEAWDLYMNYLEETNKDLYKSVKLIFDTRLTSMPYHQ